MGIAADGVTGSGTGTGCHRNGTVTHRRHACGEDGVWLDHGLVMDLKNEAAD